MVLPHPKFSKPMVEQINFQKLSVLSMLENKLVVQIYWNRYDYNCKLSCINMKPNMFP